MADAAEFRDRAGRYWRVTLTPELVNTVHDLTALDLAGAMRGEPAALVDYLDAGGEALAYATYYACERHAADLGLDGFLAGFDGDTASAAASALWNAAARLYPDEVMGEATLKGLTSHAAQVERQHQARASYASRRQ